MCHPKGSRLHVVCHPEGRGQKLKTRVPNIPYEVDQDKPNNIYEVYQDKPNNNNNDISYLCFRLHPSCPKMTRSLRYKRNNNLGVGGEATLYLLTMGDGFVLSAETGDDTAKMCRSMLYLWLQISRPVGFRARLISYRTNHSYRITCSF